MDISSSDADTLATLAKILRGHDHPFTIVGQAAHRWMGCGGCVDEALDLLLRDHQLASIASSLVQSGQWSYFDTSEKSGPSSHLIPYNRLMFLNYCGEAEEVLELAPHIQESFGFIYIRLWSEKTFHLKVDEVSWFGVPALFYGQAVIAEERFAPQNCGLDHPVPGPALLSAYGGHYYLAGKLDGNVILVPNIASYLDALVYHDAQYRSSKPRLALISAWQIRNLTRYLYLELPKCRLQVLIEVEAESEKFLEDYFNKYKRKPRSEFSGVFRDKNSSFNGYFSTKGHSRMREVMVSHLG
jgi:hypothetical protein